MAAQPLDGMPRTSSPAIRRIKGEPLAFLTFPRWALAYGLISQLPATMKKKRLERDVSRILFPR
jgi:hypothetical protein